MTEQAKTPENEETPAPEMQNERSEADEAGEIKAPHKKEKTDKSELVRLREENGEQKKQLASLKAELDEQKDKYLRMMAEYDNFRRRSQKEREAVYTDAAFDVLKDILPVADNLGRAASAEGDPEQIQKGLRMTLDAVEALFKAQGIEQFGAPGETFDPALHNAVMHDEDPERGEGEITDVFMPGYKKGDRVLRYAMVKVVN